MTKEALKLALEALEVANSCVDGYYIPKGKTHLPEIEEAITAIKEALVQPEQEPTTKEGELRAMKTELWKQPKQDGKCKHCTDGCPACDARKLPEQEPVAWRAWVSKFPQGTGSDWVYVTKPIMKDSVHNQPLYTTPPQRTWVGLTDIDYAGLPLEQVGLVRWAEAKLKEKNT